MLILLPLPRPVPCRLLLAEGNRAQAADQLAVFAETARQKQWGYGLIAVRVLQALAAEKQEQALEYLGKHSPGAAAWICPHIGRGWTAAGPAAAGMRTARCAPETCGQILAAILGKVQIRPSSSTLAEPLSERELEVLRLVAAGLSNSQIAERLVIGVSTVKSHVHNICGKLEASSRIQQSLALMI